MTLWLMSTEELSQRYYRVGHGATDPDRIRDLESERQERTDKGKPKRSFASALKRSLKRETEDTELELEGASADEKREAKPRLPKQIQVSEDQFSMEEADLGETISAADLHHRLMRFRR